MSNQWKDHNLEYRNVNWDRVERRQQVKSARLASDVTIIKPDGSVEVKLNMDNPKNWTDKNRKHHEKRQKYYIQNND
jgi:hypothetical protein